MSRREAQATGALVGWPRCRRALLIPADLLAVKAAQLLEIVHSHRVELGLSCLPVGHILKNPALAKKVAAQLIKEKSTKEKKEKEEEEEEED